jgi:hypothetical protein
MHKRLTVMQRTPVQLDVTGEVKAEETEADAYNIDKQEEVSYLQPETFLLFLFSSSSCAYDSHII